MVDVLVLCAGVDVQESQEGWVGAAYRWGRRVGADGRVAVSGSGVRDLVRE
jgi:hypothetical protein